VVYRLARDAAQRLAQLKRMLDQDTGVEAEIVPFSVRELDVLEDRIRRDADATNRFFDGYGDCEFLLVRSMVFSVDSDATFWESPVAASTSDPAHRSRTRRTGREGGT
jgi:hypothetical protein